MTATTGREPEARRGALVIGYGNTLRSDDGAGPFVARALEAAKITAPEEASAYIAMVAQQTQDFSSGDAYQVAVDTA